jgi:Ni,Fe-hydrogenase III small subunit/ferredoxin
MLTTPWPRREDHYFDAFPAAVAVTEGAVPAPGAAERAAARCPSGAIAATGDSVEVDRGRCVLCGRCVEEQPELFSWASGSDVARLGRDLLVVPEREGDEQALAAVRAELAERVRRLRRSVHVRHVDAGSDGSDEWEVQALLNPVYDIHRLGVFFTASPRHADVLLVTGVGSAAMLQPLRRTLDAIPRPLVVVASGADAISGGLLRGGYGAHRGVAATVPVDVWVPGAPATPFALLHGLLLALDRVPTASRPSTGVRP